MENILRSYPDRFPSQADLCAALGVPARTLSAYCRQSLHMGPSHYLRLRQMQRIHRRLRHADPASVGVSELVRQYGVTELGRFSGAYRKLFGELPSTTLKRAPPPSGH